MNKFPIYILIYQKYLLGLIFLFSSFGILKAQEGEEEEKSADSVKAGVYIISLYDMDFPGNKINADFYVWYNYYNDSLNPAETFELVNSKEVNKTGETFEKYGNVNYRTFRCNSVLREKWGVSDFPFDKQTVEIIIEDVDFDNTELVFIPDTVGSKIDKHVHLDGWVIEDFTIKSVDHTYETNYGDPSLGINDFASYSRIIVTFTLERDGKGLFFKLFIGLFISVLISLLTFFIHPTDLDPRFGLSVGAIFAAIASQYVISSTLPQNQTLTLVDILHDISFIYIFACILVSTVSLSLVKNNKESSSVKLDRSMFYILSISYVVLIIIFVLISVS